MGRIFRIVDEAEEYQRGYNQRESDDKMREQYAKMIAPADNHHAACSSLSRLM